MKKINKNKKKKRRFSLTLLLSAVVFMVLIIASAFALACVTILVKYGVIDASVDDLAISDAVWFIVLISIVIGTAFTMLIGKIPLKPINMIIDRINGLAAGDYKTEISFSPPISNHPAFKELSESLNKLSSELQNTEMLSEDFINNFSHEFKTPIVSIAGMAKLLKKGNLSDEQKEQYLDAIEEESMRLSYMATNVLNMTRVENQSILTNLSEYNLSEQIRSCILLLEERWAGKSIELQLEFDEYIIEANEELMKQTFINLLDNAIKFSPKYGTVAVSIKETDGKYRVTVSNTGNEIAPENMERIWNKFYQCDESHATEGNGVGLAIVKKIVELHGGEISVECKNGITSFTVVIDKSQNGPRG